MCYCRIYHFTTISFCWPKQYYLFIFIFCNYRRKICDFNTKASTEPCRNAGLDPGLDLGTPAPPVFHKHGALPPMRLRSSRTSLSAFCSLVSRDVTLPAIAETFSSRAPTFWETDVRKQVSQQLADPGDRCSLSLLSVSCSQRQQPNTRTRTRTRTALFFIFLAFEFLLLC